MKFLHIHIILLVFLFGYLIVANPPNTNNYVSSYPKINQSASQRVGIDTKVIATNLDVPWEIIWGPDNKIWVSEQKGIISRIDPITGSKNILLKLNDVWFFRTAGLLSMALHPDMKNQPYVFINYTFLRNEKPFSRLVRYTWEKDSLIKPQILMEIAANNGHSGSRISFFQGKLFWATGDAASTTFAQDPSSPNGKILRLNIDGSVPSDNPIKGSPVWAMGFRNIQGMVFAKNGKLYTSEHGDATDDEVNLIVKTKNYGWPAIQGYIDNVKEVEFNKLTPTATPLKAWTPTIAPAGMDYYSGGNISQWRNSLLLVSLKGKSLRSLKLDASGNRIIGEENYLENQFGRLRDICISPAGDVYVSTSNRDWNRTMGDPLPEDDRIIKLSRSDKPMSSVSGAKAVLPEKLTLYQQHCASCHGPAGAGLKGIFPPLKGSALVKSSELALIKKIIHGSAGPAVIEGVKYDALMPSFAFLKNSEIEEIANYVRNLQAEKYQLVNPLIIAEARDK